MKIKKALLSVWNKDGIVDLAKFLLNNDVELISTGGTKKILEDAGLQITSINDITGSKEMMDGRVKTLHPNIFGSILADRYNLQHMEDLESLGVSGIDLVVVNFYPFVQEAVEKKLEFINAIEYIDIGGPSMVRSAAKNYNCVLPLCDPKYYNKFMETYISHDYIIPLEFRKKMATKVFAMTAEYENAIYNYFSEDDPNNELPDTISFNLIKSEALRYGENPHQNASFYLKSGESLSWKQYQGKKLSYNNYADMESAYDIPLDFSNPACAIIKHANPCGFGLGEDGKEAFLRAVSTDPVSYFGGIVGFNIEVDSSLADELSKPFLECIIAPSFSNEALDILKNKKNLRLISVDGKLDSRYIIKSVAGGFLYQNKDKIYDELDKLKIVTSIEPSPLDIDALKLGWKLVRHVKSNAIVFANNNQLLGVGAGQMSRIDSVKFALQKMNESGLNLNGGIMASDAFFPFSDSIELAAEAGVSSIIQPGGSIKDDAIIKKANELKVSMVFTGIRHFLH